MIEFLNFLADRSFHKPDEYFINEQIVNKALAETLADVKYHFDISDDAIKHRIETNQNELGIFLYRLGRNIFITEPSSSSLKTVHWLMRDLCSCEIYYSTSIDEGLYIVHGVGSVIGSRNKIGRGFMIYQNCTVGHKDVGGNGNVIGDNVKLYAGGKILGELTIGNNVVVGANTIVTRNIDSNKLVYGNPLNIVDQ